MRMTPAKLIALTRAKGELLELQAYPIDKLGWIYANKNRDPGEKDSNGSQVRPPAEIIPISDFRTLYVKRGTLAAKVPKYDHVQMGAITDKSAWMSWVQGKGHKGD